MKIRYRVAQYKRCSGRGEYQVLLKEWMLGSFCVFSKIVDRCDIPMYVLIYHMIENDPESKSKFQFLGPYGWKSKFQPYDDKGILPDDYSKREKLDTTSPV